jgi:superfamily II DNA or RNA helicase
MEPSIMVDGQGTESKLRQGAILKGPLLPEPVRVIASVPMGSNRVKIIAQGLHSNQVYQPVLSMEQLALLDASLEGYLFDGDAVKFRLGVEAIRLGLAYEYDPLFSLSIARVDPLPHQLEAVYDYFLKLPRIRFLLADDPGAGKTIMAGLLIKELKVRGLIKRVLIVTPANLTFQWQREMKDKFREDFEVVRGEVLRANYGMNPWQEKNQVITSLSWVSRIEDARDSLLRSHWDLIIVDEAHKMSAAGRDKKTLAYQLGEALGEMTDHYLLMTATPHKGDPENFCLFLELLDKDVYGDVKSIEEAMKRHEAPFYLRRVKEALVSFPDAETGQVKALFTKRIVKTTEFQIDADEWDFYDALTRYVEDQSIKASADNSPRGRAIGFTMAMLQRRFASSVRAVRKSLERLKERREKILADPQAYRQEQMMKKVPENFDELEEEEQERIIQELEDVVASVDPEALRREIVQLAALIRQAEELERREVESKLVKLRESLGENGVFDDPKMKLLVFTEHKETLDYLVEKLREWGLTVTQIHGGMKIGDRDTPGTRIHAERAFREECQVMVATEAAGEGINLQFCWLMINYDIPWNPVRLEQRMGRIHRYGQEKDCLVFNFVATNTREGRVLQKLFQRLREIENALDPKKTGTIFNVLGDIFPANELEGMVREMYARNLTEAVIQSRIVERVDPERFRRITQSTLEGLAKKELNLSAIIGRREEAKERRLVPEVVESFFVQAAPMVGLPLREVQKGSHIYRTGRMPRPLSEIGQKQEPRYGRLGTEYKQVVFDKKQLGEDATVEWVTPGHALFESVRWAAEEWFSEDMQKGAVFYDINRGEPSRLDVFSAAIGDGRGNTLHRRLFVVETSMSGNMVVRQPTIFHELSAAPKGTETPDEEMLPSVEQLEEVLINSELVVLLDSTKADREVEIDRIQRHTEISLNAIIDKVQVQFAELMERAGIGKEHGIEGRLKMFEDRLDELNGRLERRVRELGQERHCTIEEILHHGRAWVLPHPDREKPEIAPMVRDEEIERIAVDAVIEYERARGWIAESVESENRGFDLISRRYRPEDPNTALEVRFIEVKGRAGTDLVALSPNEYRTAERLKQDYWLYVVFNCGSVPEIHTIQDPVRLGWEPLVKIEHYYVGAKKILQG